MKEHKKHAQLNKRTTGYFGHNEIAILGAKCSVIEDLVKKVSIKLGGTCKLAYADASHNKELIHDPIDQFTFHESDHLNQQVFYVKNPYQDHLKFSDYDLVLINGNHFQGQKQILILDAEKEASVFKRLNQLDQISLIIKLNDKSRLFDFLIEKYPNISEIDTYDISDIDAIAANLSKLIQANTPSVQGLVLAGGKSLRMGKDKGLLEYYGKSQRVYTIELLEKLGLKTFLSVRKEQEVSEMKVVEDAFIGLGPFGAICSAFMSDPNKAWLTLATDLPYVDERLISELLDQRDSSKVATAVKGKAKKFPEPLITIWEPRSYPILLQFLAQGISCPRKVLINSDVKLVEVDDEFIVNINTPEEFQAVKKTLKS